MFNQIFGHEVNMTHRIKTIIVCICEIKYPFTEFLRKAQCLIGIFNSSSLD